MAASNSMNVDLTGSQPSELVKGASICASHLERPRDRFIIQLLLKHVEYNKNQVSIMLYFSSLISGILNTRFFWVTLKSIILEFSSIMYLTLLNNSPTVCYMRTQSSLAKENTAWVLWEKSRFGWFSTRVNSSSWQLRFSPQRCSCAMGHVRYFNMAPRLSSQDGKFYTFLLSRNFQKGLTNKENTTKYESL